MTKPHTLLTPAQRREALLPMQKRAERILTFLVAVHFVFGLLLALFYDTWVIAIGVGGLATLAFFATTRLASTTFLARVVSGVVLQVFVAQHIYQMHGLAEMHFLFFTACAAMIAYLDWVAMWPATLFIIAQHLLFAVLHNSGVQLYFFEDTKVGITKLAFHFGIAAFHAVICSLWAHDLRQRALRDYAENRDLDARVRERTALLSTTAADLRIILDNVGQGFLSIDRTGRTGDVHSEIVSTWFGAQPSTQRFVDWVRPHDPEFAQWFDLGTEALFDDVLPRELLVAQMPSRLRLGDRVLAVTYRPLGELSDTNARLVTVLTDVTAESKRDEAEATLRDLVQAIDGILRDKAGFLDFFAEARTLVDRLTSEHDEDARRHLHTLKGNSAIYGIASLASYCHELETALAEAGATELAEHQRRELCTRWDAFAKQLQVLLAEQAQAGIEIDDDEWRALVDAVVSGVPRDELVRRIRSWKLEPTRKQLDRIAGQARSIAQRLGRAMPVVRIVDGSVRLPRERWSTFWSVFVHAVRNACDHGLESPEVRRDAGKSEHGTVVLATAVKDGELWVSISDDGPGIAWERVAARARTLGIACTTDDELRRALFADGLSTRAHVTETSGRGNGMVALALEVAALGGRIVVDSTPGVGTALACVFPLAELAHRGLVDGEPPRAAA